MMSVHGLIQNDLTLATSKNSERFDQYNLAKILLSQTNRFGKINQFNSTHTQLES
jgi:hypothetical protein